MRETLRFLSGVVFCVGVCVISSEQLSENDAVISQSEIRNYITAEHAVLHVNVSELAADRAGECKCKNGKCMRKCDVEKTVPCVDQTMMCVCNPEFAERERGVCQFCDCGQGISCKFEKTGLFDWDRICDCPKGYHRGIFTGDCIVDCSEDQPCKNGGTCTNNRCECLGATGGPLCEEILYCEACVNRLEADCLHDQKSEMSYCACKNTSLYYDYERDICIPCPCEHGFCSHEIKGVDRKLKCNCKTGYQLYNGYCKECDCGYGSRLCYFDDDGRKVCRCDMGFYEREGRCRRCSCMNSYDTNTMCKVTGNERKCFCPYGYEDVLGYCEAVNFCEKGNICDPLAICRDIYGEIACLCPEGYRGQRDRLGIKGEICEDIDECTEDKRCLYLDNVKCTNLPGSYKCECLPGYEPYTDNLKPTVTSCVRATKNWGPALIVIFTTLAIIIVSRCMHNYLRKRASLSN